eukprot:2755418-Pyramimonas_sp.AAC.1
MCKQDGNEKKWRLLNKAQQECKALFVAHPSQNVELMNKGVGEEFLSSYGQLMDQVENLRTDVRIFKVQEKKFAVVTALHVFETSVSQEVGWQQWHAN